MKRFAAFFLVLVMVIGFSGSAHASESSDVIEFTPRLSNTCNLTSKEWFATSQHRALLVLMLILDLMQAEEPTLSIAKIAENPVLIGKKGLSLLLIIQDSANCYNIGYSPYEKTACYLRLEGSFSETSLLLAMAGQTDDYYVVDIEDVMDIVEILAKTFSDD